MCPDISWPFFWRVLDGPWVLSYSRRVPLPSNFAISVFGRLDDNDPEQHVFEDFGAFCATFGEHDRREDKGGPLWAPTIFDGPRSLDAVRTVQALVLDFDHAVGGCVLPAGRAEAILSEALAESAALAHTSHSHSDSGVRFRLILPFSRPVSKAEFDRLHAVFCLHWPEIDHQCCDASHMYFGPTAKPGAPAWVRSSDGAPLDVDAILGGLPAATSSAAPAATVAPLITISTSAFLAFCRKMAKTDGPTAAAFEALSVGGVYAQPGHRDVTLWGICQILARKWPNADPNSIALHFQSSLSCTGTRTVHDVALKFARAARAVLETRQAEPEFSRDDHDRPLGTTRNLSLGVAALLRAHTGQGIWWDDFAAREMIALPSGPAVDDPPLPPRETRDTDYTRLAILLDERWGMLTSPAALPKIVSEVANRTIRNPVTEWLDSLVWDGQSRLDTWLSDLGAADEPLLSSVGRWFIMQACARAAGGTKADYAIVLEGATGIRKSSLLRVLFGGPTGAWFSDDLSGIGTKDASERIQGKWLIELAELASVKRSDQETLKGFLTRLDDRHRPAYGLNARDFARRCVFAGTTNDYTYVTDLTGARRFWPVRMTRPIDLDLARSMRDQLFAEGLMAVRRGDRYWPVDGELDVLAQVVERRRIRDSWEDAIEDWAIKSYQGGPLSSHYLLSCVLGVDRATRSDDLRLAQVVQRLGFVREGAKWLPGPATITRRLAVVPAA